MLNLENDILNKVKLTVSFYYSHTPMYHLQTIDKCYWGIIPGLINVSTILRNITVKEYYLKYLNKMTLIPNVSKILRQTKKTLVNPRVHHFLLPARRFTS